MIRVATVLVVALLAPGNSPAQVPPSPLEVAAYAGLHRAAQDDAPAAIQALVATGADINARDGNGRTPFHVAAFAGAHGAMVALAEAGADVNAFEAGQYDAVTIAAVAGDVDTLRVALASGNRADLVTSVYDGTALIAAAHLGHAEVCRVLLDAGAPVDHVNNLGWTALIEAVILGDGGPRHTDTVRILLKGGADVGIADRHGMTPLRLARHRGYAEMVTLLEEAASAGD